MKLNQGFKSCYQERDEKMAEFVRRVCKLYSRMEKQIDEKSKIDFIIQPINPDYRPFFSKKEFSSLRE